MFVRTVLVLIVWRIDPEKIGIMGFSAGGYVAVTVGLDDKADTRPAFIGSVYSCCLGDAIQVPAHAPPLFITGAHNDPISVRSAAMKSFFESVLY